MLGKFSAVVEGKALTRLTGSKVQELFAYLLIHRGRPQSREVLASLLWGDTETWRAKKYLRQALWQLHSALRSFGAAAGTMLCIDPEWIELRVAPELWLDVGLLEDAYARVSTVESSVALRPADAERLRAAVAVYDDHLLPGWYQDWCAYERERFLGIFLSLLDVLMADSEVRGQAEEGIRYGATSLRHDRARERTHQRVMRLHCLCGDRAAALRQYDRCVLALDEELGVAPSDETKQLYEEVRNGLPKYTGARQVSISSDDVRLGELLDRLKHISRNLDGYREQVQSSIKAVELVLGGASETHPARRRSPRLAAAS
ncbi:MAG: hypothetical protein HY270_12370 [Deltaproteobacteria bacterium]|nr:hypothetical protein [Deltaproteobacteria bacterium]